jgi:hypothetical protein
MRDTPNFDDAKFALKLYELRRESELRKARSMVGDVLDGATDEVVDAVRTWGNKHNAHFRQVTSYWEMVASFVNREIFHPDVYLDTCGEGLYTFSVLKPHLARIRASDGPRFMLQTERAVNENPQLKERVDLIDRMRADWFAKEAAKKPAPKAKGTAKSKNLAKTR